MELEVDSSPQGCAESPRPMNKILHILHLTLWEHTLTGQFAMVIPPLDKKNISTFSNRSVCKV